MPDSALQSAIASIPPGPWAVGVSGGADSVALLLLLHEKANLALHVVHLDHETRGGESAADAGFVRQLAEQLKLPFTLARRSEVEATMTDLPANTSSRYRAARLVLFQRVVDEHHHSGVILAHHADDQAETVLLRLLRGSGPMGLAAMEKCTDLGGLKVLRPLLGVHRARLREFLAQRNQSWREDASNDSDDYLRNRLRRLLSAEPELGDDLRDLAEACRDLREWTRSAAPKLEATFPTTQLADLPEILAAESARRWLTERGVGPDQITPAAVARLITMASDAGSPPKAHFPGRILVRRKRGMIGT